VSNARSKNDREVAATPGARGGGRGAFGGSVLPIDIEKSARIALDNWDALGVEEHQRELYLPAEIKRRNKAGGIEAVPVLVRNARNYERSKARVEGRRMAETTGLDIDRDKDLVAQFETFSLLSYVTVDPKTYIQHVGKPEELMLRYDTQSLVELYGRYSVWTDMLDPRFGEMSADQLWGVIERIAREKNPSPLVACPGYEQITCIVLMAEVAYNSRKPSSSAASSSTSSAGS
jgi:hypothetical protein